MSEEKAKTPETVTTAPKSDEKEAMKGKYTAGAKNAAETATGGDAGSDPARVMYIGPNRLREGLQRYQIFKGKPTQRIEGMKEKYPHIERLFVPVEKLGAALETVKRKGTPLSIAFDEVLGVTE